MIKEKTYQNFLPIQVEGIRDGKRMAMTWSYFKQECLDKGSDDVECTKVSNASLVNFHNKKDKPQTLSDCIDYVHADLRRQHIATEDVKRFIKDLKAEFPEQLDHAIIDNLAGSKLT